MTMANEVVFLLDVDNTLLDNDRIIADLSELLRSRLALRAVIDIGKYSRRCVLNSAMQIIWAPCNATVSAP